MTLLGVPTEAQFSIGTSSTTAAASSGGPGDMSLGKFVQRVVGVSRSFSSHFGSCSVANAVSHTLFLLIIL